jgi:cellobiose phosphorylase
MVGCVEGICGMRPTPEGLRVSPSIPHTWDGMKMEKNFRGSHISIKVENPDHVASGVKSLTLNGEALEGDLIPASKLKDKNEVVVVLG